MDTGKCLYSDILLNFAIGIWLYSEKANFLLTEEEQLEDIVYSDSIQELFHYSVQVERDFFHTESLLMNQLLYSVTRNFINFTKEKNKLYQKRNPQKKQKKPQKSTWSCYLMFEVWFIQLSLDCIEIWYLEFGFFYLHLILLRFRVWSLVFSISIWSYWDLVFGVWFLFFLLTFGWEPGQQALTFVWWSGSVAKSIGGTELSLYTALYWILFILSIWYYHRSSSKLNWDCVNTGNRKRKKRLKNQIFLYEIQ